MTKLQHAARTYIPNRKRYHGVTELKANAVTSHCFENARSYTVSYGVIKFRPMLSRHTVSRTHAVTLFPTA